LKNTGTPIRFYQRLFENLKKPGNENKVSVSAITGYPLDESIAPLSDVCRIFATSLDTNPANDDPRLAEVKATLAAFNVGCNDLEAEPNEPDAFSDTGGRYIELACRTGGVVTNMCEADYSTALDALGANAAGLLRRFELSKPTGVEFGTDCIPFTEDDAAFRLDCDGNGAIEDGVDGVLCVKARKIGSAPGSEALVPRDGVDGYVYDVATHAVRFDGRFIPAPGSTVEIRYNLRPASQTQCN
jgi:hypothetical protein